VLFCLWRRRCGTGSKFPRLGGATLAAGRDPSGAISAPQAVDATTYPRTGSGAGRAARGVERWRLPHLVPLGRTSPRRLVLGAGAIDLGARPRPKLVRGYLKYGTPGRPEGRWRRASSSSSGRPWARLGRPASGSIGTYLGPACTPRGSCPPCSIGSSSACLAARARSRAIDSKLSLASDVSRTRTRRRCGRDTTLE